MADNDTSSTLGYNNIDGPATAVKITSIAMVLTVIFVLLGVIFVIFLYLYTGRSITRRRATRTHFIFAAGDASLPGLGLGLNPSILLSLPIIIYRSNDFKEVLDCAVCLSELTDGEKARLLPNCNHGFHLECIDMWFHSHSTCPLCRCPVGGEDGLHLMESESLDIEGSGLRRGGMLAISIPDRSSEMFRSPSSPLMSTSRSQLVEEMKSPVEEGGSPARLKVGSLKRILSRGKRIGDVEQGLVGYEQVNGEGSSVLPKNPTL